MQPPVARTRQTVEVHPPETRTLHTAQSAWHGGCSEPGIWLLTGSHLTCEGEAMASLLEIFYVILIGGEAASDDLRKATDH